MSKPALHFTISIVLIIALCGLIAVSKTELWSTIFWIALIFVAFPVFILCWIEFGQHLKYSENSPTILKMIGVIFSVPQAVFGILCIAIGSTIITWVVYNSLISSQVEYSGGFMTLGISPMFIGFGLFLLRSAFKKNNYD